MFREASTGCRLEGGLTAGGRKNRTVSSRCADSGLAPAPKAGCQSVRIVKERAWREAGTLIRQGLGREVAILGHRCD